MQSAIKGGMSVSIYIMPNKYIHIYTHTHTRSVPGAGNKILNKNRHGPCFHKV